jgi:hypothetical protein
MFAVGRRSGGTGRRRAPASSELLQSLSYGMEEGEVELGVEGWLCLLWWSLVVREVTYVTKCCARGGITCSPSKMRGYLLPTQFKEVFFDHFRCSLLSWRIS